jgi:hypothetical protein
LGWRFTSSFRLNQNSSAPAPPNSERSRMGTLAQYALGCRVSCRR